MVKAILHHGAAFLAFALLLAGCATERAAGPTQEQSVLSAQYAAKRQAAAPSMQGEEADAIYKDYIAHIGKPLQTSNDQTSVQSR